MKKNLWIKSVVFSLIFASVFSFSVSGQQPATDPFAELPQWTFGKPRQTLANIEGLIRKTEPSGYPEIEKKLVAILKDSNTTKDAKRYICKWLAIVGSDYCVDAVAELLTDPDLSHPARIALEPMKSEKAGAALRSAISKVKGKLLAGVISSVGVRRDAGAVNDLARLATDADVLVAETAIQALGNIGTDSAAKALEQLKPQQNLERAWSRALATAAARLVENGEKKRATEIFTKLFSENQPPPARLAACVGLVSSMPTQNASKFLLEQLQSKDVKIQRAAVSALRMCPDVEVQNAVAAKMSELDAESQVLALGIFADLDKVQIRQMALKLAQTATDNRVRVAALACLAKHGEASDVPALAALAVSAPTVANDVVKTLQSMSKPGVDNAVLKLIESPEQATRSLAVNVLANRRVESVLPELLRILKGQDAALAAESAKALAVIGKPEHVADLAMVAANANNSQLRDAAVNGIKSIVRKASDKQALSAPILEAINKTKNPQNQIALMQTLVFTGGKGALDFVVKSLNNENGEIKSAAFTTLVAWNEEIAIPHLVEIAKNTADETRSIVAIRDGLLRLADSEDISANARANILRDVINISKRPEEKRRAVSILGEVPSPMALDILRQASKDASLQTEAWQATIKLAKQIGVAYPQQAIAALEEIKTSAMNEDIKKQATQTIEALKNAGLSQDGYILAWLISGPFSKEGKDGNALFNEVFPPEQSGARTDWKPYTVPANKKAGLVEFDKMNAFKGDNRVAYLKTVIVSDVEQDAMLEMGSDDGLKVWLNGKIVHSNNVVRPCSPGQDKVKIKLNKGENQLLIKLTQGGGEWAVSCRIRSADGKNLSNISILPKID